MMEGLQFIRFIFYIQKIFIWRYVVQMEPMSNKQYIEVIPMSN